MVKNLLFKAKNKSIEGDDEQIINMLCDVKRELDYVHSSFDYITDDVLIDSYIYEIQALNMKYEYYIKLCRERGLIADGFDKIS